MSSTSNVQNLLVNVFRPVYTYDPTTTVFTPKLQLSNIDTVSANSMSVYSIALGDAGSNVYMGSNAGNPYFSVRGCCNVTAVGYGAGSLISNVSNSVYLGFNAGTGAVSASNVVALGANTNGDGSGNIFIGAGTGRLGINNIYIGAGVNISNQSNQLRIGLGSKITLAGNLSNQWIGIGGTVTPQDSLNKLDVSGNMYVLGNIGLNTTPGLRTLDVNGNFRSTDGAGTLDFSNGITSSTQGYYSSRGTTGSLAPVGTSNLAPIKKGMILVSAVKSTTDYASYVLLATTTSNLVVVSSNEAGATITASGTNLQLTSTAGGEYSWVVTYTPMP